jgi:hypothetical protein
MNLIQTYKTHQSYFESVKKQRLVIRETGALGVDVRQLLSADSTAAGFVCERCNGDEKLDIKRELIHRAQISINNYKH